MTSRHRPRSPVAAVVLAVVAGQPASLALFARSGWCGIIRVIRAPAARLDRHPRPPQGWWTSCLALLLTLGLAGCWNPPSPPGPAPTSSPTTTTGAPAGGSTPAGTSATSSSSPGVPASSCPLGTGCPDPKVTPGAVIASTEGVCSTAYNPRRDLTAAAKARVLAAYRFPPGTVVAEWDHLIARWAGGTSTSSNVWPQVWPEQKRRKDLLEVRLYQVVCRGDADQFPPELIAQACRGEPLDLACARQVMREFWRWW